MTRRDFQGQRFALLLTGVGKDFIGVALKVALIKGPLQGSSHVVVATSRSSRVIVKHYQEYSVFFAMVALSSTSIGAQDPK